MTDLQEEAMTYIDRYLYQVSRLLPRKNKADILAEMRSTLVDTLEDRFGPDPDRADQIAMLEEWGSPEEVAASYFPEGQYLIGPSLYPLFRFVLGIALAAVLGAQLLAFGVAVFLGGETIQPLEVVASLINSIPIALGWLVLVFLVLQRLDIKPDQDESVWNPADLPEIDAENEIKRREISVGLVFGLLILVLVMFFPQWIGFVSTPNGVFYPNPVVQRFLGWITASLMAGIVLDLYLLWAGRWTLTTRMLKIAVNFLSLAVLLLLLQGHSEWLVSRGVDSFLIVVDQIPAMVEKGWEILGMAAFWLAFLVASIVTTIETAVMIYRLVRSELGAGSGVKLPEIEK
jgi:hypothetical protein